jgi:hypothetical protein
MKERGELYVPVALPPEKWPPYALDKSLDESKSRSGQRWEGKNLLSQPGIEPSFLGRVANNLDAIPTKILKKE